MCGLEAYAHRACATSVTLFNHGWCHVFRVLMKKHKAEGLAKGSGANSAFLAAYAVIAIDIIAW